MVSSSSSRVRADSRYSISPAGLLASLGLRWLRSSLLTPIRVRSPICACLRPTYLDDDDDDDGDGDDESTNNNNYDNEYCPK